MNIIVALSTAILCLGFCATLKIPDGHLYGLFAFFSTFAVYNGQRLYKASPMEQTPWLEWVSANKIGISVVSALSAFAAVAVFIMMPSIHENTWYVLGASTFISAFYVIKVGGVNLRQIPGLKIHLISLSWTAVLIAFPMINSGKTDDLLFLCGAHYLYVLAVTIPFDIRDLKYDNPKQKTTPQMIGVNASRILSLFLLTVFGGLMLYYYPSLWEYGMFYVAVFVQMALVLLMNERRSDLYCAGLIDGAIALLGLSYLFI